MKNSIGSGAVDNETFARMLRESPLVAIRQLLPDKDILDACQKANHAFRWRLLDPVVTVLHFLQQALGREQSFASTRQEILAKALSLLDLPQAALSSSALCQARSRLPLEVLETLIGVVSGRLVGRGSRWNGYRLLALDATTVSMPANQELFDFFTRPRARNTFMRYPLGTLATLLEVAESLIVDYRFGPYDRGEVKTARGLLEKLGAKDLLMADRHFSGAPFLIAVSLTGADFLMRKHQRLKVADLPVIKRLGRDDFLTEIKISKPLRKKYVQLPEKLVVRAFKARWRCPAGDWVTEWFVTSLTDAGKFKKAKLARLYHQRWRQETSYDEFKQFFHADVLRSKTVCGINKEMAAHVLAYQMIRGIIVEAAQAHNCKATQISVTEATRCVLAMSSRMSVAATPRLPRMYGNLLKQISQCQIDIRPGRSEPRMATRDRNHYPRLKISREQWRQQQQQKAKVPA